MDYAIVKIGGNQYKVRKGERIQVPRISQKEGEEIEITDVLLLVSNGEVKIGQPTISNVRIKAKIVSHLKEEKIKVKRFKAKSRYRKTKGFRQSLTEIEIGEVINEKEKKEKLKKRKKQKNQTTQNLPKN